MKRPNEETGFDLTELLLFKTGRIRKTSYDFYGFKNNSLALFLTVNLL
jgi:hypothetical protein